MGREKGEGLCEKVDGRRGIEGRVRWIGDGKGERFEGENGKVCGGLWKE